MDEVPRGLEVVEAGNVVDADVRVRLVSEDAREHRVLAVDLRLPVARVGEHEAVAVAEDVVALPREHGQVPVLEHRRERRLDERLPRLAVVPHERQAALGEDRLERRRQRAAARREVDEREPARARRPPRRACSRGKPFRPRAAPFAPTRALPSAFRKSAGSSRGRTDRHGRLRRREVDDDDGPELVARLERAHVGAEPVDFVLQRAAPVAGPRESEALDGGTAVAGRAERDVGVDRVELVLDRLELVERDRPVLAIDLDRGRVHAPLADVVAAEDEVVERGKGDALQAGRLRQQTARRNEVPADQVRRPRAASSRARRGPRSARPPSWWTLSSSCRRLDQRR